MPLSTIPDAVLGFMAAAVPAAGAWITTRSGFTTRVMEMVEERCAELEKEVAECRVRDRETGGRIIVLEGIICMALPELSRLDRENVVLKQVVNALGALPANTPKTMSQLLQQLHEKTPGVSFDGKKWSDGPEEEGQ